MREYKPFRLETLFNWQPQKEIRPLDIGKYETESGEFYPFYGQSTTNNGIISFLRLTNHVLNNKEGKPTILIHSNNQNTIYLETPFYLKDGHGATSVLQADFLNREIALFIITCINKVIVNVFSYNEKATKIALKNTTIHLPVTADDKIDFAYMESYIRELEAARIRELETHLKATDLADYKLTADEQHFISDYSSGRARYMPFRLGDLFDSNVGDFDIQQKHINGKGHYVVNSGVTNTGIKGKSDIRAKIFSRNTITVDMFGLAFYRGYEYKMATHGHVFSLSLKQTQNMSREVGLYFVGRMKYFQQIFSFSNMLNWNKIKDEIFQLPVDDNGNPDYDYMTRFIRIQQKLAIKNVVDWKEREIMACRMVVAN